MDQFIDFYNRYYFIFGIALAIVQIAIVVAVALLHSRLAKFKRLYERLFSDARGIGLDKLLEAHMARVDSHEERMAAIDRDVRRLANGLRGAVQHVGLVRFNPFNDTGSDQSFSVALLDDLDNGVVITSLHNRSSTRVYAKPIQKGQALYPLSTEEKEAMDGARKAAEMMGKDG